jgi:hypothetical protein
MMAQEVADLFLNLAMQLEAIEQADAKPYQRSDSRAIPEKPIGMAARTDL